MSDAVTLGELPSSITGQREGALALLVDQRDLRRRFAIFAVSRVGMALKRGVVIMLSSCCHVCCHVFFPYKSITCGTHDIYDIKIEVNSSSFSHISHISHISL